MRVSFKRLLIKLKHWCRQRRCSTILGILIALAILLYMIRFLAFTRINDLIADNSNAVVLDSGTTRSELEHSSSAQSLYFRAETKLCKLYNTSETLCQNIQTTDPGTPKTLYPLQLVSGMPGSGNDWILWLGAVHAYHRNQDYLLQKCEVYHGDSGGRNWLKRPDSPGRFYSHCPYIKTHEPFFWEPSGKPKSYLLSVERAAIILRHPFDSALSEFKRIWVGKAMQEERKKLGRKFKSDTVKSRVDGIKLEQYFDKSFNISEETPWWKWYPQHLEAWRKHAKFWLEKYDGILYIIIYKDFVTDTKQQLSALMNFFGYTFEKATLHRHCCVLDHPLNTNIKRIPSVIDPYKETLMERDSRLKKLSDEVTIDIQRILDDRWPSVYRIKRG